MFTILMDFNKSFYRNKLDNNFVAFAVADPGFPVGGGGRRQPLMRTLFSENACENERNGSCWARPPPLDPPMICTNLFDHFVFLCGG